MKYKKTILVAPLNWGLGHATRCMPIINELLAQNVNVILASDGNSLLLLKKEYPKLIAIDLPSYGISYQSSNMIKNILPQIPRIMTTIKLERQKLNDIIQQYQIDIVISDNRYGLYHKDIYSIFMTHQLYIKTPSKTLSYGLAKLHQKLINKFNTCWIPDYENNPNLAGDLSHYTNIKNSVYLGALSRMCLPSIRPALQYDILVVLSGPEPQRSILEKKIIKQAKGINRSFLIVGGQTNIDQTNPIAANITWISYLTSQALQTAILEAEIIVARSGYSTLMDLVKLECHKVFLIPTPGQTEQEYLAHYFRQQYGYIYQKQKHLNLKAAFQALDKKEHRFQLFQPKENKLNEIIKNLLLK